MILLLVLYQSLHAEDPILRKVFASIAADELRHAELSLRCHRWLMSQLTQEQRECIVQAQKDCLVELLKHHAAHERVDSLKVIGLPDREMAIQLTKELFGLLEKEWIAA